MTIIQFLVDGVVLGYKFIVNVISWIPLVLLGVEVIFNAYYPYSLIVPVVGTVGIVKLILRGGK